MRLVFDNGENTAKAYLPDEEKVRDISLMIFDDRGQLETSAYINGGDSYTVSLLKGARYSFYACANLGYSICVENVKDLDEIEYYLTYPDEYREGIPMYAVLPDQIITKDTDIRVELKMLMSKINVRMDRSRLSKDVSITVNSIRIGNCPKKTKVFSPNKVTDPQDCFRIGFRHEDNECIALNTIKSGSVSDELSLYMFENLQGKFSEGDKQVDDEDKIPDKSDPRSGTSSYIEIEMDYSSEEKISSIGPLIYRFYLGENSNNLDIHRNNSYMVTVCPENDGLSGEGWRVDKSGLKYIGPTSLEQYPGDYIVGDIGDKIHLGCILTPADTPFDIGISYLEDDKAEGIYDYEIDPDGHGVTLTLTGPGRGLIYMKADEPINDSALFVIEVNKP